MVTYDLSDVETANFEKHVGRDATFSEVVIEEGARELAKALLEYADVLEEKSDIDPSDLPAPDEWELVENDDGSLTPVAVDAVE